MNDTDTLEQQLDGFRNDFDSLVRQIKRVVVGQDDVIEGALTGLICGGHVLLDGEPGLGKTLLVRTLSNALEMDFKRIQFTSDLMPADVVGTYVVMESHGKRQFEFQKGPIFTNLLLADEINQATPKTQSALLEGLGECSVTVANTTYELPDPFFVMATQSQAAAEETYPLPAKSLDRFLFQLKTSYPDADEMAEILVRTTEPQIPVAQAAVNADRIIEMSELVRHVTIADEIRSEAIKMVLATRPENPDAPSVVKQYVQSGSSPRGAQAMILGAKLNAILDGRVHVSSSDLKKLAAPSLRHRIGLNFSGEAEGIEPDQIIGEIVK